ncbi:MAG: outer membrane lipid asymmetry maintenance protein MlaD [Gammaproteobacteria bacterium]
MRRTFGLEIGTALFVLLGIGALFFLAIKTTDMNSFSSGDTYTVTADFDNVGGLKEGAAVALAGVRIGRVSKITLDPKSLQAVVKLNIEKRYDQIPTDSSASIQTRGLLGDQYIGISPGGSLKSLQNGGAIHFTQSAIVLENLISQFMFNSKSSSGGTSHDKQ